MPLGGVAMFGDVVLKGTALLVEAFVLARALRNAPAAARHLVWSVALVGLLVIPALSGTMPWKLEVLPAIGSATVVEAPSSDRATNTDGIGALGGGARLAGAPVAGPAQTDQARMPLRGSLETERATTSAWQLPTAQQLLSWATLVWLLGVGVLSLRIAISFGAIRWMVRQGASADPADWHGELGAARSALGHTAPVRLVVSRLASMPFTTGIWRPVIVLPPSSAAWNRGRRRAVLLHELSHVRRWDVLTHFVSQAACALYWFHPLAWMAAKRMRVECERACDDLVLNSGERPADYAEHVLSIVRDAARRRSPALALPMAGYAGLEERLSGILEFDGRLRSLSRSGAGVIVASMVLTVVPLSALARTALDPQPGAPDGGTAAYMPVSAVGVQARQVPQPIVLCRDQPDDAIAEFEDANLEAAIRAALSVGEQDDLTCLLISELTRLDAEQTGIESLVGMQNLTGRVCALLVSPPCLGGGQAFAGRVRTRL